MVRILQTFDPEEIVDAAAEVRAALDSAALVDRIRPGMKVAVTAGSRGIDRMAEVLRSTVQWLKGQGAEPYVVPSMGSHGGGTSQGQLDVLDTLGIREETLDAPVYPGSETIGLGYVGGVSVYCSKIAAKADGIVVVNRVKPHTSYTGRYESGLVKMLAVGLGLAPGASAVHARGARGLADIVPKVASVILRKVHVLFGVALIENGFHRLKKIEVIPAERIMEREPPLLEEARGFLPGLPFEEADVLVVDRIGKDISGTGMNTKVVGRMFVQGETEPKSPRIRRIAVLRLSQESGGNAYGIGLADVTTKAVVSSMDPEVTCANAMASTFVERARLPLAFSSDREAIFAAVSTCGRSDPASLRIARIPDTLHISELWVSEPLLTSIQRPIKVLYGPADWQFDPQGNL